MNTQNTLEENEHILWQGRKNLVVTMLLSVTTSVIILIFMFIFRNLFSSADMSCTINGIQSVGEDCQNGLNIITIIIGIFALIMPLLSYIYYHVTKYAVTEKRVIFESGIIGTDIKSIYFDQIKDLSVNVGLVGKIFSTGTISLDTGKTMSTKNGTTSVFDMIENIDTPYDVYKIVQKGLSERKESLYSGRTGGSNI